MVLNSSDTEFGQVDLPPPTGLESPITFQSDSTYVVARDINYTHIYIGGAIVSFLT